jgi:hypothetical protein
MLHLLAFLLSLIATPQTVEGLRSTAPKDLTTESARWHLGAAVAISIVTDTNPYSLLAIAHHESRYKPDEIMHEYLYDKDGKPVRWIGDSCGVMTPFDTRLRTCRPDELEIVGGYLAGAKHLAVWQRICRGDRLCALRGYSGNMWDRQVPGAKTWVRFSQRAAWIQRTQLDSRVAGI